MQAHLHQVQLELDAVRGALDEESAARTEVEHKLSLANTEITQWKSKFDAEVVLHHEEVEDLRYFCNANEPQQIIYEYK